MMISSISRSEILRKLLNPGASIWECVISSSQSKPDPPVKPHLEAFLTIFLPHELQDLRLDSRNGLFLNIKQNKKAKVS